MAEIGLRRAYDASGVLARINQHFLFCWFTVCLGRGQAPVMRIRVCHRQEVNDELHHSVVGIADQRAVISALDSNDRDIETVDGPWSDGGPGGSLSVVPDGSAGEVDGDLSCVEAAARPADGAVGSGIVGHAR